MNVTRFESLGDNCEFGFVLRTYGVKRGGLFRWALTTVPVLCNTLGAKVDKFYRLENLEPSNPRMLRDKATGLRFHSEMIKDSAFVENYFQIYQDEIKKIHYLYSQFQMRLADPACILVYKDNRNPDADKIQKLADTIKADGKAKLLYVTRQADIPPGEVRAKGGNLYYGKIDRLAEYSTAQDFSKRVWGQVLENADKMIPHH